MANNDNGIGIGIGLIVTLIAIAAIAVVAWFAIQLLDQNKEEIDKPVIDVNLSGNSENR